MTARALPTPVKWVGSALALGGLAWALSGPVGSWLAPEQDTTMVAAP